jgi:drug/metabolite transporter (DMT)-like permease
MTTSARTLANRRGVIAMIGAMTCFVINDAFVKYASESLPGGQIIVIRGLFAIAFLLAAACWMGLVSGPGARLREITHRPVVIRSLLDAVATFTFLTALFHLPLANATAINMAAPLGISLLSVLWLGERIGTMRWAVIAIGFVGVLFIVQPRGEGFNGYSLVCLLSTFFVACRDLYTRRINPGTPTILITIGTAIAVTATGVLLSIFQEWKPIDAGRIAMLAAASVFLSGGYMLLIRAMRAGEVSVVVPFRYSGLLAALTIGFAVWGEIPNALAWIGIALLVSAGLYMVLSERNKHAQSVATEVEKAPLGE